MKADISKALFLDLAFVVIAALVLLVKDPSLVLVIDDSEVDVAIKSLAVESGTNKVYEDTTVPGESLFLRVGTGEVWEVQIEDVLQPIQFNELEQRLKSMAADGERVVVLQPQKNADYGTYVKWRNCLLSYVRNGTIQRIEEI